jgi:two-component system, OmpR family, phosphate regulon response regulator OmpR
LSNTPLNESAHIVVCDDEPDIRDTVAEYLGRHGYSVTTADGGPALRELIAAGRPIDVVVLDIRMPGEDGLSLTRHLRERSGIAIILLTGSAEIVDRVVGLEVGADDYVTKPFDLRELLARIKAVLRRTLTAPAPGASLPRPKHRFAEWELDVAARRLLDPHQREVPLTSGEFDLLSVLVEHAGRVLSRDFLLEHVWGYTAAGEIESRTVDVHVRRLRQKLGPAGPRIGTVTGVGYRLERDD